MGTKYIDLLESVDSIKRMYECGNNLSKSLIRIEKSCEWVVNAVPEPVRPEQKSPPAEFSDAERIKRLIESPEMVWSALDDEDMLLACAEYLSARYVHRDLRRRKIVKFESLWRQRWTSMSKFPQVLMNIASRRLRSHTDILPVKAYTDAIATMVLLSIDTKSTTWCFPTRQVLDSFLRTRSTWIEEILDDRTTTVESSRITSGDVDKEKDEDKMSEEHHDTNGVELERLCKVSVVVQETLRHGTIIFSDTEECLLQRILLVVRSIRSKDESSENSSSSLDPTRQIETLWSTLFDRKWTIGSWMPKDHVRRMLYDEWLHSKVDLIRRETRSVLQHVGSVRELAHVQAVLGGEQSKQDVDVVDGESGDEYDDDESLSAKREEENTPSKSSKMTSMDRDLWCLLFRDEFRTRMQELLQSAFEKACEGVERSFDTRLRQLARDVVSLASSSTREVRYVSTSASVAPETFCDQFDKLFAALLEDVRILFSDGDELNRDVLRTRPEEAMMRLTRYFAAKVQPFKGHAEEPAEESAEKTAEETAIKVVEEEKMDEQDTSHHHLSALLISRICSRLACTSSVIQRLLPDVCATDVLSSSSRTSRLRSLLARTIRSGVDIWARCVAERTDHIMRDGSLFSPYTSHKNVDAATSSKMAGSVALSCALFFASSQFEQCSRGIGEDNELYGEMRNGLVKALGVKLWDTWSTLSVLGEDSADVENASLQVVAQDFFILRAMFGDDPKRSPGSSELPSVLRRRLASDSIVSSYDAQARRFVSSTSLLLLCLRGVERSSSSPHAVTSEDVSGDVSLCPIATPIPRFALLPVEFSTTKKVSRSRATNVTSTPSNDGRHSRSQPHETSQSSSNGLHVTPKKALDFVGKVVGPDLLAKATSRVSSYWGGA